jgi:hypothetical protein
MIQRCDNKRLALEPFGESLGGDFDRNIAIESRIPRTVDLTHSAKADRRENLIRAKKCAWGKSHVGILSGRSL